MLSASLILGSSTSMGWLSLSMRICLHTTFLVLLGSSLLVSTLSPLIRLTLKGSRNFHNGVQNDMQNFHNGTFTMKFPQRKKRNFHNDFHEKMYRYGNFFRP